MKKMVLLGALLGAMSAQAAEVMTWVPAYSINQSYEMLNKDFGGVGMKDGLTRLALQLWQPTLSGRLEKDTMYGVISDADIKKFADWGDANNVEVQLCIYNPPIAEGQHWNWPQAQAAFNNPNVFVSAVIAEIDRLAAAGISIDGVDMDLESSSNQSAKDQKKYIAMMKQLSVALKARGKKLTAATYAAKFNAPNIHYWPKLARFIDGITPMAYDKSGYQVTCDKMWNHPADWCDYQAQINQVSPLDKHKFTLGTPGTVNYGESAQHWMGKSNIEHLKGIRTLGAGLAIWDAVLHPSWQTAEVWNIIKDIKLADANSNSTSSSRELGAKQLKYGVRLRGENFEMKTEDGVENLGFFTTRFVKANTPEEAELKAVEMVRTDKYVLENLSDNREFEPKIYLEEMWLVRWWKRTGGKGYTFYQMEPKE